MKRTDTSSRVMAAPPDRVYAALVDPEALIAWLPPAGMSDRFERFDARPGGSYRLVLNYADASTARGKTTTNSDIVQGRFVDLVPGARVVQALRLRRSRQRWQHDHDLAARLTIPGRALPLFRRGHP